jgi:hypothetical protein
MKNSFLMGTLAVSLLCLATCTTSCNKSDATSQDNVTLGKLTGTWKNTQSGFDKNGNGTLDSGELSNINYLYMLKLNSDKTGTIHSRDTSKTPIKDTTISLTYRAATSTSITFFIGTSLPFTDKMLKLTDSDLIIEDNSSSIRTWDVYQKQQ